MMHDKVGLHYPEELGHVTTRCSYCGKDIVTYDPELRSDSYFVDEIPGLLGKDEIPTKVNPFLRTMSTFRWASSVVAIIAIAILIFSLTLEFWVSVVTFMIVVPLSTYLVNTLRSARKQYCRFIEEKRRREPWQDES